VNAVLVVPCYDEAKRIRADEFVRLSRRVTVSFVDDGSKDDTPTVLEDLCARSDGRARWTRLASNSGKGEAVRQGLLGALDGADAVGFADADLATPVDELVRLLDVLERTAGAEVALGSRVRLLGNAVDRPLGRHLLGRAFATAASRVLGLRIYDTQCGAKWFRVTPALRAAIAEPFLSRWIFDVELLGRLVRGGDGAAPVPESVFVEVPLLAWRDVEGSKLRGEHFVRAAWELMQIRARLDARARRGG
jgi:glycosyltransferase involved in cell wall biosynthesis